MKALLVYNPNSGILNDHTPEDLSKALADVGYEPTFKTSENPQELDEILSEPEGLVVIAGGDGTVRQAASRMVGKDIALVILPLGTANNISRALNGKVESMQIIAGLSNPRKRYLDVGRLCSPWGEDYFLESLGMGIYASILKSYKPEEGKSIRRGIESILEGLEEYEQPKSFNIILDGQDISGNYMLVEILNTPTIGPRLRLANHVEPDDGLFDIVRVKESANKGIAGMLSSLIKGEVEQLPNVFTNHGKELEIHWDGFPLHLDDQVLPAHQHGIWRNGDTPKDYPSTLKIEILTKALEFWVPKIDEEREG
jgi:diacylglycerol kinase (ATP)